MPSAERLARSHRDPVLGELLAHGDPEVRDTVAALARAARVPAAQGAAVGE